MTHGKAWAVRLTLVVGAASSLALSSAEIRAAQNEPEPVATAAEAPAPQGSAAPSTKNAQGSDAAEAAAPTVQSATVGDVVVTTETRQTSPQKTPAAITVLSGETLQESNTKNAVDLNGLVPGLTVTPNEGWSRVVAIRGVGFETAQNSIAVPSVAFQIDGIYVVNPISLQQGFLDVSRLDVQRGPQGTAGGQNAIGGSINVITNQPDLFKYSGSASVGYGTYNLDDVIGDVNVPIIEGQLAARIAFEQLRHDGFAQSTALYGYQLDDANNINGRIEVLWAPTNDFSANFMSQIYNSNTHDVELKNINDPNPNPRLVTQDYPGRLVSRQYIQALTLKWSLDWATLKSVSSYQIADWKGAFDNDRLNQAYYYKAHDIMPYTGQTNTSWTQELNLASPVNAPFDWTAGIFYLHTINTAGVVEYYNTYTGQPTPVLTHYPIGGLPANFGYGVNAATTRDSYSGYGQSTFHITDALRFIAGARYTHDQVNGASQPYFGLYGPTSVATINDGGVTGKLALEYDLTESNMAYASVSRGYKPGGTNLNQTPNLVQTTFQPESLDAFEIGSKNRFFDKAATANFAAFYYNYNNFQFIGDDPVPYQGGVANIPTAHSYGVEADFGTRLPFDLRLDGNAALLHSEITSNYYALDSTAADAAVAAAGCGPYDTACLTLARSGAVKNIKGNPLPKMPSFAGSLALTHTYATSDGGAFTSRIQVVYQGNYVYRVFNNSALDTVPSYGLWNLYFGYTTPKGDWNFSLTGTNILNTNAISSRFTNAWGLNGTTANQYVPPQQVIARVSYQF